MRDAAIAAPDKAPKTMREMSPGGFKRLGVDGYGRIEFAFSVVFLLVLLLRDSSDVIVARELSRHPRLIRPLVDQVLAYKTIFALILFSALVLVGSLTLPPADSRILALYGTMLFTTAIGLDFVFRGTERMGPAPAVTFTLELPVAS